MTETTTTAVASHGKPTTAAEFADVVQEFMIEQGNGVCPGVIDGVHVVEDPVRDVVVAVMPSEVWEKMLRKMWPGREVEWPERLVEEPVSHREAAAIIADA